MDIDTRSCPSALSLPTFRFFQLHRRTFAEFSLDLFIFVHRMSPLNAQAFCDCIFRAVVFRHFNPTASVPTMTRHTSIEIHTGASWRRRGLSLSGHLQRTGAFAEVLIELQTL